MAEEKVEPRETSWRQLLPWTELFRGFQVALDPNKMALAAAGILVMAFLWWLLSVLFSAGELPAPPTWPGPYLTKNPNDPGKAWKQFKQDRNHWNLMNETAGIKSDARVEKEDLLDSYDEFQLYQAAEAVYDKSADQLSETQKTLAAAVAAQRDAAAKLDEAKKGKPADDPQVKEAEKNLADAAKKLTDAEESLRKQDLDDFAKLLTDEKLPTHIPEARAKELAALKVGEQGQFKPYATLATWPWWEDRGPNPFLMTTGQLGKPWETGHFWDWLFTRQIPYLIEPVVKLLLPIVYFFSPGADLKCRLYVLCVLLATVLTWSVFGGAITRIAVVQVARGDKIGLVEALNFTRKRLLSYLTAPLFPLLVILVLLLVMFLFGLPYLVPWLGDVVVAGLCWPVMIAVGLLMALALVGLVGWPLMSATVSAEGSDSWEAVSRAYSYVYQKPWHFIWYTLVALVYGAVVVFFIGFMGSMTVYLAKWGVSTAPTTFGLSEDSPSWNREPNFLFVYAPTSFGWRSLLLKGAIVDGQPVVDSDGQINVPAYKKWIGREEGATYHGPDQLGANNLIGAFFVAIWLGICFLLILGFSYSYFWSASSIIYLLLRRNVDGAEMDEVTLDDEEGEGGFGGPLTTTAPPPPTAVKPGATSLTMVDAPSLRPTAAAPPAPPPEVAAPPPIMPLPPPSSPSSPEAAAAPVAPGPPPTPDEDGGGAPRTEVGTAPTEPGP